MRNLATPTPKKSHEERSPDDPLTSSICRQIRAAVLTAHLRQDEAQHLLPGQWVAEADRGRR